MKYTKRIIILASLVTSCGRKEPEVSSPFSSLDTVKAEKKVEKKEEKNGSSVSSPFSNIDKKD